MWSGQEKPMQPSSFGDILLRGVAPHLKEHNIQNITTSNITGYETDWIKSGES